MKTSEVIARSYAECNGQECRELIDLGGGEYIVAINGQVPDARRKLTVVEAAEWFDSAAYQIGQRPARGAK